MRWPQLFKPTKAHEREISKGQMKIRMGGRVPKGAVNLAYSYVTPLTPDENVQIADTSGFVLENVMSANITDITLWPDDTHLLRSQTGTSDIYSQTFLLTNIFKDETPLYYAHRLKHLHHDKTGPDRYGFYQGKSIIVVNKEGEKVGDKEKYVHILLKETSTPNVYFVDIYTSFQVEPGEEYRAIYNALYTDENNGEQVVLTGFNERLNPQPAFSPREHIYDMTNDDFRKEPVYYRAQNADFGYSQIYVPIRPIEDTRRPKTFQYRVIANVNIGGTIARYPSPWIGDSVLNADSLIELDGAYRNGFKKLTDKTAEELVAHYYQGTNILTLLNNHSVTYSVESSVPEVEVTVKTDGKEPALARTRENTGEIFIPQHYQAHYRYPFVEFDFYIRLRNKTTGHVHDAVHVGPFKMRRDDGFADIKTINYAEWDYPSDYDTNNYEVFVELSSLTVPVSLSVWDRKNNRGWGSRPIPATEFGFTSLINVAAEVKEERIVFSQKYSLRPTDNAQIRVLRPIARDAKENWYLRIKNGRFYRSYIDENNKPQGYGYFIPEYYNQAFDKEYGIPYRYVQRERPQIVDTNKIKLRYTPLYIHVDKLTNKPTNIQVKVNDIEIEVKTWNATEGIVELYGSVRENDNIEVFYYYQETCYEYRGFYDEERKRFWYLDLNPGKGHFSTQYDSYSDEVKDLASFGLINKTVYIYMKPAGNMSNITQVVSERVVLNALNKYELEHEALRIFTPRVYLKYADTDIPHVNEASPGQTSWEIVEDEYLYRHIKINNPRVYVDDYYTIDYSYIHDRYRFIGGTFQKSVLFHTFEEIEEPNTLLLAKIQVRPNSARDGIQLTDTRSRGGGLLRTIGQNIINEIMPEANSYWDIGYWDGDPYPENGVVIIKLPRFILKSHGGKLTKEEVEAAVEKHLAFGVFYIIEYIEEPNALIEVPRDLVVEAVDFEDPTPIPLPKPSFILITEG